MGRKSRSKSKRRKHKADWFRWWTALDERWRRHLIRGIGTVLLLMSLTGAGTMAMVRVDRHVREAVASRADPTLVFADLPEQLADLAEGDLRECAADVFARSGWLEDRICLELAQTLEKVAWISHLNYVRRTSDARFEVSGRYRFPAAMVQQEEEFFLVDAGGVRLPGTYLYDPARHLLQGVVASAPIAGSRWHGADLQAALRIVEALAFEPYAHQITAVLVHNYAGRVDNGVTHIQLATDRAGGRIRWGSAPGRELEENSVSEKLAILRENYHRTGRADANHPVIDISTLPGRYLAVE